MSLTCIKEGGLMVDSNGAPRWGDSLALCYYDGMIQAIGQAEVAIYPSQLHYAWDLNGNIVHRYTAPFPARAETCVSLLGGKITSVGSTTTYDVWQFDPTIAGYTSASWSQITSNFIPSIGQRIMATSADVGGWFFIIGGWNRNTVYKTQDFTNWTLVATLPTELESISACGCCVFNGLIWIIGGSTNMSSGAGTEFLAGQVNGRVFTLDPDDGTITEVHQDQERFGQVWLDAVATDDYIYVLKGYISSSMLSQYPSGTAARFGNNRGLMRSADGQIWEDLSLTDGIATLYERHRAGAVKVNNNAYFLAGFNANDMWKI